MLPTTTIPQHNRSLVIAVDHHIQPAVVVQIPDSRATRRDRFRIHRHRCELAPKISQQQRRLQIAHLRQRQFDVVHHMTLRDEEILPAIVVKVGKLRPPAGVLQTRRAHSTGLRNIVKPAFAIVEHRIALASQSIHKDVWQPIVIVVGKVRAHAGKAAPIAIVRRAQSHCHFLKRAIVLVSEQLLWNRIVGDEDVRPAIAIEVLHGDSQALARVPPDAACLGNIPKTAIAFVVIDKMSDRLELIGMAIVAAQRLALAAEDVHRKVPYGIARDDQIQQSVTVVVDEERACGPARATHPGLSGDVTERAVAVVAIERIVAVTSDVQIGVAVVVIVRHGDAHAVAQSAQPGLLRHVSEGAIPVVAIEPIPEGRVGLVGQLSLRHGIGEPCPIDKEDVELAIAIVIDQSNTARHRLDQILLRRRARPVQEADLRSRGRILKRLRRQGRQ